MVVSGQDSSLGVSIWSPSRADRVNLRCSDFFPQQGHINIFSCDNESSSMNLIEVGCEINETSAEIIMEQ